MVTIGDNWETLEANNKYHNLCDNCCLFPLASWFNCLFSGQKLSDMMQCAIAKFFFCGQQNQHSQSFQRGTCHLGNKIWYCQLLQTKCNRDLLPQTFRKAKHVYCNGFTPHFCFFQKPEVLFIFNLPLRWEKGSEARTDQKLVGELLFCKRQNCCCDYSSKLGNPHRNYTWCWFFCMQW